MRLLVDIARVTFTVTKAVAEKCDQNKIQKKDRNTKNHYKQLKS